jgi:hypothetical protein
MNYTNVLALSNDIRVAHRSCNLPEALSRTAELIDLYDQEMDSETAWGEIPYLTAKLVQYHSLKSHPLHSREAAALGESLVEHGCDLSSAKPIYA